MTKPDLQSVKQTLVDAGVEIYRSASEEIQVAERVRFHIMDSGVRVRLADSVTVAFTARSQRSDFPHADAADLFDKVREQVGSRAAPRGYREADATTVEVKDPVDSTKVLDVWHEVTYEKTTVEISALVDEVRWALGIEKYVAS